ncbi:MAG: hypothetical protein HOC71_11475 [Candidatus Latescibacteria bacterium]|jgi:hypothetical protein|nr:hypothetical protein [Candidatus Latescibacterota bacterium]
MDMGNTLLNTDQISQLVNSWNNAQAGSEEQKLIEDLFLITETPMPGRLEEQSVVAA